MLLPAARGPLSAGVIAALLAVDAPPPPLTVVDDPERLVHDADFQLALWMALGADGFDGVAPERADDPEVLRWRSLLSEWWSAALHELTTPLVRAAGGDTASPHRIGDHLIGLISGGHTGLRSFAATRATTAQLRELAAVKALDPLDRMPAVAFAAHNTARVLTGPSAVGFHAASAAVSLLFERNPAHERTWTELLDACREHLTANPGRTQELLHAAAAAIVLEVRLGRHLLHCWTQAVPVLDPVRTVLIAAEQRTRPAFSLATESA
ncbi:hypothetical protein JNUCC0626_10195 [Lentzea sp. JNUCC 0626]|uniref:hypothetical protein n=1 Tax=Lentzea sp. JNUCC 0626 TaxID=3367513 RepID=UPI0037492D80